MAKAPKAPPVPSQQEIDDHLCSGHATYRSWCPSCVAGRGRSQAHRAIEDESRDLPLIAHDYTYLAEKKDVESGKASPVLVSRCNKSQWMLGEVLPCKGGGNKYNVMILVRFWNQLGHSRMLTKCDQEPAMQDHRG